MTNDQSQKIESHNESNIGKQFRQKREALNLSLEEVSKETNLKISILERIEANNLNTLNLSPTFVKGYVHNYARFLNLPNSIWEPMVIGLDESLKKHLGRDIPSVSRINSQSFNHKWIGYITGIVVFIIISMSALWWWENYQQLNEERDHLVNDYINRSQVAATDQLDSSTKNSIPQELSVDITKEQMQSQLPITDDKLKNTSNKDLMTFRAISLSDLSRNSNLTIPVSNKESTNQISEVEQIDNKENMKMLSNSETTKIENELIIEITGTSCWLSVKDNKRNILAQKEYKQGEILTFDNSGPYSLIIGAPANVKITYKGEDYPLTVDGRVARFKLQ